MKIKNQPTIQKNTVAVPIARPSGTFHVIVTGLPLGWRERMRSKGIFDVPQPPVDVVRDRKTGLPVLDADHKAVCREVEDDPVYIRAMNQFGRRVDALMLVQHLRDDKNIEFESVPPAEDDPLAEWHKYADAIWDELTRDEEGGGLTEFEIASIIKIAREISNSVNVEKVITGFLLSLAGEPTQPPSPAPSSPPVKPASDLLETQTTSS